MQLLLDTSSLADYERFIKIKALPRFSFTGRTASFPDEYAHLIGENAPVVEMSRAYEPIDKLFDYQRDISRLAIAKRKFAIFARCGIGKTMMMLEWLRYVDSVMPKGKTALIVSPLMVIKQTIDEAKSFYGDSLEIEQIRAKDFGKYLNAPWARIGITNYESIKENLPKETNLFAIAADESSSMKSFTGRWANRLIDMGKGLDWKLCLTGTPAPNDRIEYANHAIFLDQFPTVNSFLSRFFVNRGQTQNRWEMRPHAVKSFYRSLSHWCIFLSNPAVYGWKDNIDTIPPINVTIHDVDLTDEQSEAAIEGTGTLYPVAGGIVSRSKMAQIAKGKYKGKEFATNKPEFIRNLVNSWPERSTIIWCRYNAEQELIAKQFPECANISGTTKETDRFRLLDDFKSGRKKVLVSKADCLGFGLNLQIATRMVFSTLQDSYEEYAQCLARANRIGSTESLEVHLPLTQLEIPMVETVLAKAKNVDSDMRQQEAIFKECNLLGV